jgi:subtilisin-like proprotein convertase family protein
VTRRRFGIALILAILCATAAFAGTASAAGGGKKTFSNNTAVPIPDTSMISGPENYGVTDSIITVSGLTGPITNVTASFYISHTSISDLDVALIEPGSSQFSWFFSGLADSGDDFGTDCTPAGMTTMDDAAASTIDSGTAPFAGSYQPSPSVGQPAPLSNFNGLDPNGDWNLSLYDLVVGNAGTLNCWSLSITTATDGTMTFNNTDVTPMNDATEGELVPGGPGMASSPLNVSGVSGYISAVTLSLWITHTSDSDLDLTLIGPGSDEVALTRAAGGQGDNFGSSCANNKRTTFDDKAKNALAQGVAPFVGTYRPQSPLAKLNGLTGGDVNGVWNLEALDNHKNNTGIIKCWSLTITTSATPVPPLPDLSVNPSLVHPRFLSDTYNHLFMGVKNNTADPITDVTVTSTLPAALADVTDADYYTTYCDTSGQTVTCHFDSINAGETLPAWVRVYIPKKGKICVEATVSSPGHSSYTKKNCTESIDYPKGDKGTGYEIGDFAHNFVLQDQNGNPASLAQHKGKFVLLQWSSVWCPPSQIEVPQDRDEVKALNDDNVMGAEVVYLQVLIDGPDENVPSTLKNAQNWVTQKHLTTPVLFTANDTNFIAEQQWFTYTIAGGNQEQPAVPVSIFIDPSGKIFDVRVGAGPSGDTTDRFEAYLN